jgi:hypothetical protein
VIVSGTSSPSDWHLCSAANENLDGLKPKRTIATFKQLAALRLVAQGTDFWQQGAQKQIVPRYEKYLSFWETCCNDCGMATAVQLNMNCSY